jgi:hypothetical protein
MKFMNDIKKNNKFNSFSFIQSNYYN